MDSILDIEGINRGLSNNIEKDLVIKNNKREFSNIVEDVLYKGADYAIKSLPINTSVKDVLIDIKNSFRTKDFKEILKTAVNSSIREGLELLSIPKNVIKDITKIKNIAFSGGLKQGISACLDIISKKYLKGNIFQPFIEQFFKITKNYLFSNDFSKKIDRGVNNFREKAIEFKNVCKTWYRAYEEFDIGKINDISKELRSYKKYIVNDKDLVKQGDIIENMTQLINAKKDKLSKMQLQMCNTL